MQDKWLRSVFIIVSIAILAGGCAAEREPINRVQADALAKSFFVGDLLHDSSDDPEFWTQATLIDVGYGAAQSGLFTSTWTQHVSRIKWVVTEEFLLGRLTYELIDGSDGKGVGPASNDGQIVVAYRIEKHFDIRRAYNPSTGEEYNVIEENVSDRPWNDREYMRVDWSKNINTGAYDFDTLAMLGVFGVKYSPLDYYVNDPKDPDAPFFDTKSGYFDITNKAFAEPKLIDVSDMGWWITHFPACWTDADFKGGSFPSGSCNSVEVTVRHGFRRVEDTDYEPADWDGFRFQSYGGFYTERYGYARNYGMSDDKWHRFLTRYNIWQRSHAYGESCDTTCECPAAGSSSADCAGKEGDEWDKCVAAGKAARNSCIEDNSACFDSCVADAAEQMTDAVQCFVPEKTPFGGDPGRDADGNGTDDECEAVTDLTGFGGSRCDTFKQRCTLPFRARTLRPLAWYYTTNSDPEYYEPTRWATHDHDVGMRHAVQVARYAECTSTGGDDEDCMVDNPVYFGQMDDHLEAKQLAKEVDNCRLGLTHTGVGGEPDLGELGSEDREAGCVALADSIAEARSNDGDREMAPGVIALAAMPEQITLCHSPVEATDPAICAPDDERLPADVKATECAAAYKDGSDDALIATCKAARNVRRGDLRYHLVNVMGKPQTPSPWGIYTDAEDPLTGETFSAGINVWSHVNDLWSQAVIDRVRYIKGELATEEITDGSYVNNWVKAAEAANGGGLAPKMTRRQIQDRISELTQFDGDVILQNVHQLDDIFAAPTKSLRNEIQGVRASLGAASSMAPIYAARSNALAGTELEASLITKPMQLVAGTSELPLTDKVLAQASILRGQSPFYKKQARLIEQVALAKRGMCVLHQAPAPMAIGGIASILEDKFADVCSPWDDEESGKCIPWGKFGESPTSIIDGKGWFNARAEAMRKYVAHKAHYAVIVHEMGHSIGERHNFVSSSDAFSYRPQYWQLRTDDGKVTETCDDYRDDGAGCVGPRYFDPTTDHENDNLIWMWMHSSVMDYAGEYAQDFLGLGSYDIAAHRMFYGQNVAVFDDPSYAPGEARGKGMMAKMDSFGGLLGFQPEYDGNDIHYSDMQNKYDLISDCKEVDVTTYQPTHWDEATQGKWHPVLDGFIVPNRDGKYTKCRQPKVKYVPWKQLRMPTAEEQAHPWYYGGPAVDAQQRIRVPYGFATDRWADLGNASVYRHDNGADVYEIFDFLITQQEVQHIFDNYRRGRQNFSVSRASSRLLGRYNEKIRDGAKGLGLLKNIYREYAKNQGWAFEGYWAYLGQQYFRDNYVASGMVFDHFTRMMSRPEAGGHYRDNGVLLSVEDARKFSSEIVEDVRIPDGASGYFGRVTAGGKYVESKLSEDKGEFDSNYTINAGSYYDKTSVSYLMTESEDNFISDSRSDFVDGRYRAVSLADLFPDGYRRWLGNSLTGDESIKGARLAANQDGTVKKADNKFPAWPIGWTTWWGDEPTVCFPQAGTTLCDAVTVDSTAFNPQFPESTIPVDSQIGFDQQKFLIAQTFFYLPANQKRNWLDMLRVYKIGADSNPELAARIEFHDPNGSLYVARTYGKEVLFGQSVQKGIAARVLGYANGLLEKGYVTTAIDYNSDSVTDWYVADRNADGDPIVKYQAGMTFVDPESGNAVGTIPGCSPSDNTNCPCSQNLACTELESYNSVVNYLWWWSETVGNIQENPSKKGIY